MDSEFVPFNEELGKTIYEETQGISDLVIKIFVYSQQLAIENGKEELSIDLIKKLAKEKFRLLQPMLEAIRSGNPHKIAKYEDIRRIDLEKPVVTKIKEMRKQEPVNTKRQEEVKVVENTAEPRKKVKRKEYKEDDLRYLLQQGVENEKTPYQVLLENEYIEDATKWIEAGTP
ncbi:hypothetical protein CV093_04540 [Oceanobacillus sp. 143]|nr:hypothetical protein CV093_04540 [Oceanobacillus sp. 143]